MRFAQNDTQCKYGCVVQMHALQTCDTMQPCEVMFDAVAKLTVPVTYCAAAVFCREADAA